MTPDEKSKLINSLDEKKLEELVVIGISTIKKSMNNIIIKLKENNKNVKAIMSYYYIKDRMEYFGISTLKYVEEFKKIGNPDEMSDLIVKRYFTPKTNIEKIQA